MSVQAMSWAMKQQLVKDPTARHVLLCLSNYPDPKGIGAFPSVDSLCLDTGLSERTVRAKLDLLEKVGAIRRGNQVIAQAHIGRADRRPVVYDVAMERGESAAPRDSNDEVQDVHPENLTGCSSQQNGVQMTAPRGAAAAPKPKANHQLTEKRACAARFDEFFSIYPKQVKRKPSLKVWIEKGLDERADKLVADVRKRIDECQRWKAGYAPDPSTYLRDERWEDDIQLPKGQQPCTSASAAARAEETPLECELRWIRNRYDRGEFGEGDAALATARKLSEEATAKHRAREAEKA